MFANDFALNRYETWELDAMVAQIERPNPWLLRTFFPTERHFTTAQIEFDLLDRGRRMAPFVSPLVAGKPMRREGYRTRVIAPAYIKPTAMVVPGEGFTRLPGEGYGGTMTPQQRFDKIVAEHLDLHQQMIDNRMEWMAASALVTGSVTIEGEDYPRTFVDFGRDPSLSGYLVGAAKWTLPTSSPMDDIEAMALQTRIISKGAVVNNLVMDGQAWNALKRHSEVQDLIDIFFRRNLPGQTPTSIDAGPRNDANGDATYVGTLNGRFDLWVYDSYYQDDTGVDQPYLPPFTVLGVAGGENGIQGRQYFGAILDLGARIQALRMFSKSKLKFDPSALELVTQSAPIVAPRRPNACFVLRVG